MNYRVYMNSRDLAWRVLIGEEIRELPVPIVQVCKRMGIRVQSYEPQDDNDGISTILNGQPRIFVSRNCTPDRARFTVAHELGHILLGHVGKYQLVCREPSRWDNPIEQAANVFASRLLAPAGVLWALNASTPERIAELCRISMPAARIRAERMKQLRNRGKFLISPLERRVLQQFETYIREQNRL